MSATNLLKIISDDLELRQTISPDGWNWLLSSLDPFHDFAHPLAGYPDLAGAPSVVLEMTRTISISAAQIPQGFMHVYLCPFSLNNTTNTGSLHIGSYSPGVIAAVNNVGLSGGVLTNFDCALSCYNIPDGTGAISANTTGDLLIMTGTNFVGGGASGSSVANFTSLTPPGANLTPCVRGAGAIAPVGSGFVLRHGITAPHRVIGAGFEVTNTTAPLYRSGSVVVYDSPSNWGTCDTFMYSPLADLPTAPPNPSAAFSNVHFEVVMGPPSTLDQAILLPNSKQWGAEEGAYCVAKFSSMDNRVTSATTNLGGFTAQYGQESNLLIPQQMSATNSKTDGYFTNFTNNQLCLMSFGQYNTYPFNGVGSWFTGLDTANTSFQITCKWYLEVFPNTFFEQNLVPTTSPSACYDPVALEVYARVVSQLPPGVPVKDNFVGLIGSAIGGLAKMAVGGIKNAISNSGSKSAVDMASEWNTSVRKFGGGTSGVQQAMRDPAHNFIPIKDLAQQNLQNGVPQIRANFVDEGIAEPTMENAARMYHLWFGSPPNAVWPHANYPGEEPGGATHQMVTSGNAGGTVHASPPMQSHACNCPPHPSVGYQNSTGPRTNEFLGGVNMNPSHIGNFIQSAVDKGINAAVRKLGLASPARQPMALTYDDYADYPEASAAVQARRRAARARRAEQIALCREKGVIPPLTEQQLAAIAKQRAKRAADAAKAAAPQ
jgi:hypothetical protein